MAIVHITVSKKVLHGRKVERRELGGQQRDVLVDPGFWLIPGENVPVEESEADDIARANPDAGVRVTKTAAEVCGPHHLTSDEEFRAHLEKVGADPAIPHPCPHREVE